MGSRLISLALAFLAAGAALADEIQLNNGGRVVGRILESDADRVVVETTAGTITIAAKDILSIDTTVRSAVQEYYDREAAAASEADMDALAAWARANGMSRKLPDIRRQIEAARRRELDEKSGQAGTPEDVFALARWAAERGLTDRCGDLLAKARQMWREELDRRAGALPADADAGALYDLATWGLDRGLAAEGQSLLERTIRRDPNHEFARRKLGYVLVSGRWLTRDEAELTRPPALMEAGGELERQLRALQDQLDQARRALSELKEKLRAADELAHCQACGIWWKRSDRARCPGCKK
jgi:hypothetical protein